MNLRMKVLILGGVFGALLGVGAAYLYLRSTPVTVDPAGKEQLPTVNSSKALTAGLGLLTAIRQIVGLGQPGA